MAGVAMAVVATAGVATAGVATAAMRADAAPPFSVQPIFDGDCADAQGRPLRRRYGACEGGASSSTCSIRSEALQSSASPQYTYKMKRGAS